MEEENQGYEDGGVTENEVVQDSKDMKTMGKKMQNRIMGNSNSKINDPSQNYKIFGSGNTEKVDYSTKSQMFEGKCKNMFCSNAKSKFNMFKDSDKDGVINVLDCEPFNKKMQGATHNVEKKISKKQLAEETERLEGTALGEEMARQQAEQQPQQPKQISFMGHLARSPLYVAQEVGSGISAEVKKQREQQALIDKWKRAEARRVSRVAIKRDVRAKFGYSPMQKQTQKKTAKVWGGFTQKINQGWLKSDKSSSGLAKMSSLEGTNGSGFALMVMGKKEDKKKNKDDKIKFLLS